jgi:hypothetical protein
VAVLTGAGSFEVLPQERNAAQQKTPADAGVFCAVPQWELIQMFFNPVNV